MILDLGLLVEQVHHDLGVVEMCLGSHAECDWKYLILNIREENAAVVTHAEDKDEDAVDDELPDGGPHIDLLVYVDGRHLPGGPHPPHQVGEPMPAAFLRCRVLLLQQREIIRAPLAPWGRGRLRLRPGLRTG